MTLKTIVAKWLKENGYDGLYGEAHMDYDRCGCRRNDLFPCGADPGNCRPGYLKWGKDQFGNRAWTITPEKEAT